MKVKAKSSRAKLGLPTVFLLCSLFFFAGLFISTLLSHASVPRSVSRTLEPENDEHHGPMMQGDTGDSFIQSIPFQVLSWRPRALYFPRFATAEQCESVIEMAKTKLRPSTLALRKGETAESTKGTRTSSGTFISASEDDSGVLDIIEEKIARATMLPRAHGEENSKLICNAAISSYCRHSTFCGMRLARSMIHIMMHSIQRNMVNRKAKDLFPSCCIYPM
ncbi:prolyl 4-hydroxylase 9 [Pyrus ussuriensis x Pyrus communis]|uniref:Prolyl 4-hydroxylase 9 n=1 Tax=Pyrus ussuriensis x Pyrus communis TaxID=2448454 RepID=A0A5N5IA58_9ROSA|nr:prolyl 4-hydroxylase 9 [Pyrus ussuriensis x Pyrus communis]